jgi:hypothetical protein
MNLWKKTNNKNDNKNDAPRTDNKTSPSISQKQLERYKDPTTGLTLKKLKMGLWVEEHTPLFKKILIAILIFVCVGLWIYIVTGFGWYIFKGMKQDEQMINEITKRNLISHEDLAGKAFSNLNIGQVGTMKYGSDYDLWVGVKNTNEQYRALFDYCFLQGEREVACGQSFIFPQKTKYVLSLANELDASANISFRLQDIKWRKINYREIRNWDDFLNNHLDFVFEDIQFNSASQNDRSDKKNLNSLSFRVINDTPYGYWEVPLNVFLYDTGSIVGVNRYVVNKFHSGEEKEIELVWPAHIGRITNIEIKPDINIMDKDVYMKPQAAQEIDRFLPEQ